MAIGAPKRSVKSIMRAIMAILAVLAGLLLLGQGCLYEVPIYPQVHLQVLPLMDLSLIFILLEPRIIARAIQVDGKRLVPTLLGLSPLAPWERPMRRRYVPVTQALSSVISILPILIKTLPSITIKSIAILWVYRQTPPNL